MKEHPILFTGPLARAIREGRKTVTRRPIKPQPTSQNPFREPLEVGDRLWVKETFASFPFDERVGIRYYRADFSKEDEKVLRANSVDFKWTPSIFMHRYQSRTLLRVDALGRQRLQAITDEEAKAEGLDHAAPRSAFAATWDRIYDPPYAWADNPWVRRIQFSKLPQEIANEEAVKRHPNRGEIEVARLHAAAFPFPVLKGGQN